MRRIKKNLRSNLNKKIALVSAGVSKNKHSQFTRFLPMTAPGLHYIAATLRQEGYQVQIINQTTDGLSNKKIIQIINKFKPGYLFINQFFNTRKIVRDIVFSIEKKPIIVVGGHDVTFHSQNLDESEFFKQYRWVDYVWQGEAEQELVSEMLLMTKQKLPVIIKKLGKEIRNLDKLPILKHVDYAGDVGFLSTSRGCLKMGCDMCTTPSFYPEGWRARGINHVAIEIKNLKKANKQFVFICDDNFLGFTDDHLKRGNQIIKKCKEANLKVMIMTTKEQILKAEEKKYLPSWKGVVYRCFLGIEGGGGYVKKRIGKITNVKKHAKNSQNVIKILYDNNISLLAGWINFKPDSKFNELKQDAKFLYKNGTECAYFTNLCQSLRIYEGTKIYKKHKHRKVKIRKGEFDYDFDVPEIGKLYRFLMFKVKNKITNQLDSLIYEITNLVYINQLQNSQTGIEYWRLRNRVNKNNYNFFMKCLDIYKSGKERENINVNKFMEVTKEDSLLFKRLNKKIIEIAEYK